MWENSPSGTKIRRCQGLILYEGETEFCHLVFSKEIMIPDNALIITQVIIKHFLKLYFLFTVATKPL